MDEVARAWIAEELTAEGFHPLALDPGSEPLPLPSDPDALPALRKILARHLAERPDEPLFLHPGTTAWAERPELAALSQELGIRAFCAPGRVLSLFANQLTFLSEAERFGIPNLLLSHDPMHSAREIERNGFRAPYILKAVRRGGPFAHFVVQDPEDLETRFPLWGEQLRRGGGEAMFLAERYLEGARQIVVPYVRFPDGRFEAFPLIDASLQCLNRKMIEFCPAGPLEAGVERALLELAEKFASGIGMIGAGTLDFLVDGARMFLIGGAARLSSTFRLWETVAGTRAVAWQVAAFEGRARLPDRQPPKKCAFGAAVRIFAEDPILQLPQPGHVQEMSAEKTWDFPGAEAEFTPALRQGSRVPHASSGALGALWAFAQDRKQALTVARGALEEIWIAGSLQTNERFATELLSHPWVREGVFHAGFVDEEFLPAVRAPEALASDFAAVCALAASRGGSEDSGAFRWAVGDQWVKSGQGEGASWSQGPDFFEAPGSESARTGVTGALALADGRKLRVCAYPVSVDKWQVRIGSWSLPVRRAPSRPTSQKRRPRVLALVGGRVHSLLFREGARIPAHEPILVIESLGRVIPHALPIDIEIRRWKVAAEDVVHAGQELAELETPGN